MIFQIICYLPENISYLSGAQLEGGRGVATSALFVGGLMCAVLATVFHPHSPKPCRSVEVGITKIASMVP